MALISLSGDGQLTEGLTIAEIRNASQKGAAGFFDDALVPIFAAVRKHSGGSPVRVGHAHDVTGHVAGSAHYAGQALDLWMSPAQLRMLKKNLPEFMVDARDGGHFGGFGVYDWGIHVDTDLSKVERFWDDGKMQWAIRHWAVAPESPWMKPVEGGVVYTDNYTQGIQRPAGPSKPNWFLWILVGVALYLWVKKK